MRHYTGLVHNWYLDGYYQLRTWVWVVIWLAAGVAFIVGSGAAILLIDKSGCEQKAVSRPDIPMEWHWNTGCIQLRPDTTVVISS